MRRTLTLVLILSLTATSCAWIARASVDSTGTEANADSYLGGSLTGGRGLSADGRYVVFVSEAANLVANDTNGMDDVFVRDNQTGTIELVSTGGTGFTGWFTAPAVSDDGQRVVYNRATICACPEFETKVFYRDLGEPEEVLVSAEGFGQDISADGRHVAFAGVAEPGSGDSGVFVRDMTTGITTRVSVDSTGTQDGGGHAPSMSADGRRVVFQSSDTNLVPGDTNDAEDVFVHDTATGTTTRVSVDSNGSQADAGSGNPVISADGRYVAFASVAGNLVSGDTNGVNDVFVHDTQAGTTSRVSVGPNGGQGNFASSSPSISADGTRVAFTSAATFFGFPLGQHVYVRDTAASTTTRVSADATGALADGPNGYPAISANGQFVAFESDASNLVAGDTNAARDVIVRAVDTPSFDTVTPDTLAAGTTTDVTIAGSGFGPGTSVATFVTNPNGVTVDTLTVVSPTELQLTVTVDPAAAPGPRNLYLQVPGPGPGDGGMTASLDHCPDCLTITP